jgi:hypothetical protein
MNHSLSNAFLSLANLITSSLHHTYVPISASWTCQYVCVCVCVCVGGGGGVPPLDHTSFIVSLKTLSCRTGFVFMNLGPNHHRFSHCFLKLNALKE